MAGARLRGFKTAFTGRPERGFVFRSTWFTVTENRAGLSGMGVLLRRGVIEADRMSRAASCFLQCNPPKPPNLNRSRP